MNLAQITVNDFGGAPVATHNMPCAVCGVEKAVLIMATGIFEPCWECQKRGWTLGKKRPIKERLMEMLLGA